jgi:6-phosphogluconate dehydrogenase
MSMKKKIAYIGLGKMGFGMVSRLLERGWEVSAFDPSEDARKKSEAAGVSVCDSLETLSKGYVGESRLFWIMVPHAAVTAVLNDLLPLLCKGDVVIDGGNSNYKKTIEHAQLANEHGVVFMDVGVSGGPGGARDGACCMIGGDKVLFDTHEELFKDISSPEAYGYMGQVGAGHFVKMVHNGIEYGMMQAIGEGFEVMKRAKDFDIDLSEVARVYNHQSVIESRLIGWLQKAYREYGQDLENISGTVAHSGEGQWTVETAHELEVPVLVIEASLAFREASADNPSYTGQVVSALRNQFGGHEVKKRSEDGG